MKGLPTELNIAGLLSREFPKDITVLEMRWAIIKGSTGALIFQAHPHIKNPGVDILDENNVAWPDEMLLSELRAKIPPKSIRLVFRDGGIRQKQRTPELV